MLLPKLSSDPCSPADVMLTRVVMPVVRSRTNTSDLPLVSPVTRLEAWELNATTLPSGVTVADLLLPFAGPPSDATLTRTAGCAAACPGPQTISPATSNVAVDCGEARAWRAIPNAFVQHEGPPLRR